MSPYYKRLREKVGPGLLLIPSVAAVVHNENGELLLQEKANENWSLPAGAIEPGESPEEAIQREVLEETGLVVKPNEVLGVFGGKAFRYAYPNGHQVEYTVILYRCHIQKQTAHLVDPETKSLRYFPEKTMPPLALPYPIGLLFKRN